MVDLPPRFLQHAHNEENVIAFEGVTYRWINPAFPLPPNGPRGDDCATAGSYIFGQHMNAKGRHGILYTALRPEVAAIEVLPQQKTADREHAEAFAVDQLAKGGFQLFEIESYLQRVLDLRTLDKALLQALHASRASAHNSCQDPPSQHGTGERLGWFALKEGFDGILRPSSAYQRSWGNNTAAKALVLDILCPNLKSKLNWSQVR